MQGERPPAAQAAGVRAEQCRRRRAELATGQAVGPEDVRRARRALVQAMHRTEAAQHRLAAALARRQHHSDSSSDRPGRPGSLSVAPQPVIDLSGLRQRALQVCPGQLHSAYFALGGRCDQIELDGFLHAIVELPAEEVPVLAQAVWELTEF